MHSEHPVFYFKVGIKKDSPSCLATYFVAFNKALVLLNFVRRDYLPTVTLVQCIWVFPAVLSTGSTFHNKLNICNFWVANSF